MSDLFALDARQTLRDGAVLLRSRALAGDRALLDAIEGVVARSPFRRMVTPGAGCLPNARS
jgi:alkylated DNA repair protein (DNA oxidative demethylase)